MGHDELEIVDGGGVDAVLGHAGAVRPPEVRAALEALEEIAEHAESSALSDRSRELYAADWRRFTTWCARMQLNPLPAEVQTVRLYLADMASLMHPDGTPVYKVASIERHLAAIAHHHHAVGAASPVRAEPVAGTLRGLRRLRQEQPRRLRPLLLDDVRACLRVMDTTHWPAAVGACRDAFVLLAGFAGAFRRSEIAGLRHRDITFNQLDGLLVRLTRTKTDQEGHGVVVPLPFGQQPETCVPCRWVRWTRVQTHGLRGQRADMMRQLLRDQAPGDRHICRDTPAVLREIAVEPDTPAVCSIRRDGTVNRSAATGSALHEMVRRRASAAGFDLDIGFHSLRAGFVTQARRNGVDPRAIRRQTRHASDAMVDVYDREYAPLQGNAVTGLGL